MRTTIRLPDDLLQAAKLRAVQTSRTLTNVIEEALRAALASASPTQEDAVSLPTFGRGGVRPGVDLDDTASLLELMEEGR
ncbi:MAG: type II toxin-antitoxin system VapB family antitoxin [Gemmatimonadaceae bacterium]